MPHSFGDMSHCWPSSPKSQVGFAGLPAHVVLVGSAFKVYCKHMDGCLHIPDAEEALGKWRGEREKEGEVCVGWRGNKQS